MDAAARQPERRVVGARPFELREGIASQLLEVGRWHECPSCLATFGTAEGLRGHRRFSRCPVPELLDPRAHEESRR
jgi:hypothetical protein